MSIAIRQMIGPAKARLLSYIQEVDQILMRDGEGSQERLLFIRDAKKLRKQLDRVIQLIAEQNDKWTKYMADRPTKDERDAATAEYTDFNSGEDSFTSVLDKGREAFDKLESGIEDEASTFSIMGDNAEVRRPAATADERTNASFLTEDMDMNIGGHDANAPHLTRPSATAAPHYQNIPPPQSAINLGPINLLRFNGDREKWAAFWDMFDVAVHSTCKSDIEKYSRLLSHLDGEAEKLVRGYNFNSATYQVVVQALKDRYGLNHVLADDLQAELMTLPAAKETTDSLRKTSDSIERICRQLKQLGTSDEHPLLRTTIKSKFPRSFLSKLAEREQLADGRWSVTQLRRGIQDVIAVREEVQRNVDALKETSHKPEPRDPKRSDEQRAESLNKAERSPSLRRKIGATKNVNQVQSQQSKL
ncbi:Pao retrotransposon peptidase family protein [Ditylenchus destructor]|uniref:Pao retrotransposon peptidase family protein n=1 Tax=Ditylenchus destructor TaxID=166010 RepID=A0AAD4ME03_9BILA|nr:Pao retrotransposon peptidase family protein [Ditylenchus destructor]